jgi:hypothetical protein
VKTRRLHEQDHLLILRHANRTGVAVTTLQLAGRLGGGSPGDVDSLAPSRMEIVLADEISSSTGEPKLTPSPLSHS